MDINDLKVHLGTIVSDGAQVNVLPMSTNCITIELHDQVLAFEVDRENATFTCLWQDAQGRDRYGFEDVRFDAELAESVVRLFVRAAKLEA